jgi:GTP diphosphokinase / guanosine-3',5'-bis(diphosphate) 3'-diphosphatase
LEDTKTESEDLAVKFGDYVANGVGALSKNPHLSRGEQLIDSVQRIQDQPQEIWMVKLCDRIVNLQKPPKFWSQTKIDRYKKEAIFIAQMLGSASIYLKRRLWNKIDEYGRKYAT